MKYGFQLVARDSSAVPASSTSTAASVTGKRTSRETDTPAGETATAAAAGSKRARAKEPGEEYRSKKAGGDVWKRGMMEPHAFIPLDPRLLSKKHTREAVAKFGAVHNSNVNWKKSALPGSKTRMAVGNRKQRRNDRENKSK